MKLCRVQWIVSGRISRRAKYFDRSRSNVREKFRYRQSSSFGLGHTQGHSGYSFSRLRVCRFNSAFSAFVSVDTFEDLRPRAGPLGRTRDSLVQP